MRFIPLLICMLYTTFVHTQNRQDWSLVSDNSTIVKTSRLEYPRNYKLVKLESYTQLFDRLSFSPLRSELTSTSQISLNLPLSVEGGSMSFQVVNTPLLASELQGKYPHIRTYTLISEDGSGVIAKIDFGDHGFHAMIFIPGESPILIDPFRIEDNIYMVYRKMDYPSPKEAFHCGTQGESQALPTSPTRRVGDCQFREYRLALACTGEYAQYHGGTISGVMSAFTTSMNRVNGVYEKEVGITMKLVPNNDMLIYLDGATDPYTNGNGGAMLGQNQTTCDDVIGSANYDIGHVFSTGGGGVAALRAPCNNSRKARGVTGRGTPVGDPFDIDYVAHEMGHQFGGNHTQNNDCNDTYASYEPGSASTIMGYAGICNPNVQSNSDDYFHAINLSEIAAFVTNGSTGGSCDNILSSSNGAPSADAGLDFNIPSGTAFALKGIATDPDSDPITYCWEQFNAETSPQPPSPTNTEGPNFRTKLPTTNAVRELPNKGFSNTWEVVSNVDRDFDFRLTVRDFNSSLGYGCTEEDDMIVSAFGEIGPFKLITANGGETWNSGSTQLVTWDVAGSHSTPVNCSHIDIYLSTNNGNSYPYLLATNVPNDGSHQVNLPSVTSSSARLKIMAYDNIFFDVSDQVFDIEDGNCPDDDLVFDSGSIPAGNYYANNSISASVPVDDDVFVFMQANRINLNADFFIPLGAEFEATNGVCP